jgi:hypothetical protein
VVHVYDYYVTGDLPAIKQRIKGVNSKEFKLKVTPDASRYLSCESRIDVDNGIG